MAKRSEPIVPKLGRLFDSAEAAAYLGMSMPRLRRLVAAKKIAVVRDGRLGFFERDLDDWIEKHRTPAVGESKSKHIVLPKPTRGVVDTLEDLMPKKRR